LSVMAKRTAESLAPTQLLSFVLCITCRILYDGDMLYGSTIPYTILVVDALSFNDKMCYA
jgi:hypothetical protein